MSNFEKAYSLTMSHEGGYVFDPDDVGGETYKGISRAYNSSWEGWRIIDILKSEDSFPKNLDMNSELQRKVKDFYRDRYFEPFIGAQMPEDLAIEMFDTSVNMGVGRAVKFLQISLNVLNRNQKLYPDMVEDGAYGPTTHRNLYKYLQSDSSVLLCKMINVLQGNHYINYMKKSPRQEKYARGWFNRVDITKR